MKKQRVYEVKKFTNAGGWRSVETTADVEKAVEAVRKALLVRTTTQAAVFVDLPGITVD